MTADSRDESDARVRLDEPEPSRLAMFCAASAAILFIVEKIRVTQGVAIDYTTEDQTIFWWVTKDYQRLHFPEPLFYGSPYSSHLESLIAAPFVSLGASLRYTIPIVTALLTAAPFLLLAYIAWKRGLHIAAILVLSSHFLLPVEYGALATQSAQPTGVAIGGLAAAPIFSSLRLPIRCFLFGLLGTIALCLHPNSIYLVGPAAAYLTLRNYRNVWFWVFCGTPAVAVAVVYYFALHFYTLHPEFALHRMWSPEFSWSSFQLALNDMDRHIGDLTPTPFHAGGFMLLMVVATAWLTMQLRDWNRMLATAVLVFGVLASFAMTKVHDGSSSFTFPYSRVFYGYSLGVVWLFVLWSEVVLAPTGALAQRAAWLGACTLLAMGLWRQVNLTTEIERVLSVPTRAVSLERTDDVNQNCKRIKALAQVRGADLVIHANNRVESYACGAKWYGQLDNIYPPYDRRTEVVLRERDRIREKILVVEPGGRICRNAKAHGLACEMIEGPLRAALITSPQVSALTVADWLGIPVRHL